MSLQVLYSFEHIRTDNIPQLPLVISSSGGCSILTAGGRDNSQCLAVTDILTSDNVNGFNFAVATHAIFGIGAWVVIEEIPVLNSILLAFGNPSIVFPAPGNKAISLCPLADGSLRVWGGAPGAGGIIATSPSGVISYGAFQAHYIEMYVVIQPSPNGQLTVRVDGVPVINQLGINTELVGVNQVTHILLGNPLGSSRTRYDDIYVVNGTDNGDGWTGLKGVLQVEGKLVNGAGEVTQWFPTTPEGTNWNNVDDVTPDINTFNTASVVGTVDLYNIENVSYVPIAIQPDLYLVKVAQGPSSVSTVLRPTPAGANFLSSAQPLSVGFRYYRQVYTKNPQTNLPWTNAEFNQLQVGVSKAE